jgi:hypothetical protein
LAYQRTGLGTQSRRVGSDQCRHLAVGFFGQNFGWLVRNVDGPAEFVVYGIGGLVVPLVLLFTWLRRSRKARTA